MALFKQYSLAYAEGGEARGHAYPKNGQKSAKFDTSPFIAKTKLLYQDMFGFKQWLKRCETKSDESRKIRIIFKISAKFEIFEIWAFWIRQQGRIQEGEGAWGHVPPIGQKYHSPLPPRSSGSLASAARPARPRPSRRRQAAG